MTFSIIKKSIVIFAICSISFSQTGNDFLNEYPFGKKISEMTDPEYWKSIRYTSLIEGIVSGNDFTLAMASSMDNNLDLDPLSRRVCGMTLGQQVRILKKFCDNNPADTHQPFEVIVFFAFGELPSKSKSECNKIINRGLRNP